MQPSHPEPRFEGAGLLVCERPAQGLQAGPRGHRGVQKNFPARCVGQKNKLTYRRARKSSRPRAIHDQRTQSTYLFGAVCPELGVAAVLQQRGHATASRAPDGACSATSNAMRRCASTPGASPCPRQPQRSHLSRGGGRGPAAERRRRAGRARGAELEAAGGHTAGDHPPPGAADAQPGRHALRRAGPLAPVLWRRPLSPPRAGRSAPETRETPLRRRRPRRARSPPPGRCAPASRW